MRRYVTVGTCGVNLFVKGIFVTGSFHVKLIAAKPYASKSISQKLKFLPRQWRIGRCLSPFLVALGHTSANAVKATAGGGAGPLVAPCV